MTKFPLTFIQLLDISACKQEIPRHSNDFLMLRGYVHSLHYKLTISIFCYSKTSEKRSTKGSLHLLPSLVCRSISLDSFSPNLSSEGLYNIRFTVEWLNWLSEDVLLEVNMVQQVLVAQHSFLHKWKENHGVLMTLGIRQITECVNATCYYNQTRIFLGWFPESQLRYFLCLDIMMLSTRTIMYTAQMWGK